MPESPSLPDALKVTRSPVPGLASLAWASIVGAPRSRITLPQVESARFALSAVHPDPVAGSTNWLTWVGKMPNPSLAVGSGSGIDWSAARAQRTTRPSGWLVKSYMQSNVFCFGEPGDEKRVRPTTLHCGTYV